MLDGADLARAVLKAKDRYELLSLGVAEGVVPIHVTKEGYLNLQDEDVRRCYTRIAARIHPDKLQGFADATKAFQALVRAYELCCKPDLRADDSDDSREDEDEEDGEEEGNEVDEDEDEMQDADASEEVSTAPAANATPKSAARPKLAAKPKLAVKLKQPKSARTSAKAKGKAKKEPSHEVATEIKRTGVKCPRCRADWGAHLRSEGHEGQYTMFMRGQLQVHCLSCLFEFGCLTAGHHCPFCDRGFEYRPGRFHKPLHCPNNKQRGVPECGRRFRVMQFTMGRQQQEELERKAEEDAIKRERKEASASARNARSERYRDDSNDDFDAELGAFVVSEDCPRCGQQFTTGHAAHLKACKGKEQKGSKGGAVGRKNRQQGGGGAQEGSSGAKKVRCEPKAVTKAGSSGVQKIAPTRKRAVAVDSSDDAGSENEEALPLSARAKAVAASKAPLPAATRKRKVVADDSSDEEDEVEDESYEGGGSSSEKEEDDNDESSDGSDSEAASSDNNDGSSDGSLREKTKAKRPKPTPKPKQKTKTKTKPMTDPASRKAVNPKAAAVKPASPNESSSDGDSEVASSDDGDGSSDGSPGEKMEAKRPKPKPKPKPKTKPTTKLTTEQASRKAAKTQAAAKKPAPPKRHAQKKPARKRQTPKGADSSDGDSEDSNSPAEKLPSKMRAKALLAGRPSRGGRSGSVKSYTELSDSGNSDS